MIVDKVTSAMALSQALFDEGLMARQQGVPDAARRTGMPPSDPSQRLNDAQFDQPVDTIGTWQSGSGFYNRQQ